MRWAVDWLRGVLKAPTSSDRKLAEAATTLHVVLLGGAAVALVFLLIMPRLHPTGPWPSVVSYASMLGAHLFALRQIKRGRVRPVAIAMAIFMFTFVTINAYMFGGLSGVGIYVYPSVVIFAGVTWSASAAVGLAIAASLATLAMGLVEPNLLHAPFTPPTQLRAWLTLTGVVSISAVMLWVARRSLRLADERERVLNDQLQAAQRLEAMGRLASGVAHDFNNLLTVILLHSSLLKVERRLDEETLAPIEQAALRAAEMTQQLLALSRRQTLLAKEVDINAALRATAKLVQTLLPASIQLTTRYDDAIGHTKMDPAGLERVVINLVVNARDAMPNGGEVTIETHSQTVDESAAQRLGVPVGRYTKLSVSDTGQGISDAIRPRLFEPFATTKGGKGTGLGLASVHGIVVQSGGSIEVESAPGRGTRFEILLPAIEEAAPMQVESLQSQALTPIRVLVMDEDTTVRAALRTMLESAGYVVRETNAAEHTLDKTLHDTDLLLTDGIDDDTDAMDDMRARHPRLRVAVVRKPFTRDQLLETLSQSLSHG